MFVHVLLHTPTHQIVADPTILPKVAKLLTSPDTPTGLVDELLVMCYNIYTPEFTTL